MENKFVDKFDRRGCKELGETMLKRAVKEKDRRFFETGDFEMYQHLTDWKYKKEDYLQMIDDLEKLHK